MWSLVWLVVLAAQAHAAGYCSNNTFPSNSSWMHFNKEPVPFEYGFEDKFKSIHCCVKGYRSIEWFKDGVAYPWSAGVSNLILYPEAANQTLYTRRAARADSGNYTCRLSNETHSETHTVLLDILEKPADSPKIMFISKDQRVAEGGALRLFCEALIGRSYLADARSDLRWYKLWPNGTEAELLPSHNETKTSREDIKDIIGSYLTIGSVSAQDYGDYVCVVHSNDVVSKNFVTVHYKSGDRARDSEFPMTRVPWRIMLIGGCCLGVAMATAAALRRSCLSRVVLAARHAARSRAQAARVLEKEFDVLVCYTEVDGELVRGALIPTLALKYKYRVHSTTISTQPDYWYSEIVGHSACCRSTVVVLSPAQYSAPQLLAALRLLPALPQPPVVVLLQDLPKLKREAKECGESLVGLVRRTRLVAWRHLHERAFWDSLRLALPLPPPTQAKSAVVETKETCSSRSGSMTALV